MLGPMDGLIEGLKASKKKHPEDAQLQHALAQTSQSLQASTKMWSKLVPKEAVKPSSSIVQSLMEIGDGQWSENACIRAALATRNDIQNAAVWCMVRQCCSDTATSHWCLQRPQDSSRGCATQHHTLQRTEMPACPSSQEHGQDLDFDDPIGSAAQGRRGPRANGAEQAGTTANGTRHAAVVQQLMGMGDGQWSAEVCRQAATAAQGNFERALEWCLENAISSRPQPGHRAAAGADEVHHMQYSMREIPLPPALAAATPGDVTVVAVAVDPFGVLHFVATKLVYTAVSAADLPYQVILHWASNQPTAQCIGVQHQQDRWVDGGLSMVKVKVLHNGALAK